MLRIRKDDDFILDSLTDDVIQRLDINKSKIAFMKQEILKTEALLSKFQICLVEQNYELNNCYKEGRELEKAITKCPEHQILPGLINTDLKSRNERITAVNVLKHKIPRSVTETKSMKETKPTECAVIKAEKVDYVREEEAPCSEKEPPKSLKIEQLKNKIIYILKMMTGVIYIGGSCGLLLTYHHGVVTVFETDTNDDIVQIETLKIRGVSSLIAFTNNKILIFPDAASNQLGHVISLRNMAHVFNEGNLIFITLADGRIKRLTKEQWKLTNYPDNNFLSKRFYNAFTVFSNLSFVSLEDSRLYRSDKKELRYFKPVPGVVNVRTVLKVNEKSFLCYSDDTVWLIDTHCDVLDTALYEHGIKFVSRSVSHVVIVDGRNVIRVYKLASEGIFGDIVCDERVEDEISAVTLSSGTVYVAVRDVIFGMNFAA